MCGKFILLETRIIEKSCGIFDLAQDFGLGLGNGEHKARFDEMVGHVRSSRKIGSGQSGLGLGDMSCPFPLPCSSLRARSADAARRAEESLGLGQWLTEGVGTVSESKRIADTSTPGAQACRAQGAGLAI